MVRLRIIHKMLLGFTLYLAIAVGFGIYVYSQNNKIIAKHQLAEILDDVKNLLMELLRNEKDFLTASNQNDLERIHTTIAALTANLQDGEPEIRQAFVSDDYQTLTAAIPLYAELIEKYQQNNHQTELLTRELQELSLGFEKESHRFPGLPIRNEIPKLRFRESNYLRRPSDPNFSKLIQQMEAIARNLDPHSLLHLQSDNYLSKLDQLQSYIQTGELLLRQVRKTALTMEKITNNAELRERAYVARYSDNSRHLLIAALGALLFFGSLLSWIIAKIIALPLQRLEATTRQIAAGEHQLRIAEQGDAETYSLQHSFNAMLDSLQTARESLARSLTHLQMKGQMLIHSEKLASIGILASGVAHEINNPLANISLTTEMLQEVGENLPPAKVQELLATIISQTERAAIAINNLMDYARASQENDNQEVDLVPLLQQSLLLVAHELKRHAITLKPHLPSAPLPIVGNRGQLHQVFVNILLNALQAMTKKGTLIVSAEREINTDSALLQFIDNGPGLGSEPPPHPFDPVTTSGLGFYVSHDIILEHGGTVQVENTSGQGTKITISLPLTTRREEIR